MTVPKKLLTITIVNYKKGEFFSTRSTSAGANIWQNGNGTTEKGGTTKFKVVTGNSGDLATEIESIGIENGTLANLYTKDGKANQMAWTRTSGGNIDASSTRTDLIMQGNFSGGNDTISADFADDSAQSADATGEKYYSTIVEGLQFGFEDNSDVLYICGTSSSREIKQNYIESLKEMFNSLIKEINEQEKFDGRQRRPCRKCYDCQYKNQQNFIKRPKCFSLHNQ